MTNANKTEPTKSETTISATVVLGSTKHIFLGIGVDRKTLDKEVHQLLLKGGVLHLPGGVRQWYDVVENFDVSKDGVDRFTWSADGNRTKHTRYEVTKSLDGTVERRSLGTFYKSST